MRKSLLGILLAATLLPMSVVHAAGEASASYSSSAKATDAEKKKAVKDAIAKGVAAGLTVQQAMAELLSVGADAAQVISAAIAAAPAGQAGVIAAFAISQGVAADAKSISFDCFCFNFCRTRSSSCNHTNSAQHCPTWCKSSDYYCIKSSYWHSHRFRPRHGFRYRYRLNYRLSLYW